MKNKKYCEKSGSTSILDTVLDHSELNNAQSNILGKPSQELLEYYKNKSLRLEKEFDNLSELLDNIKSACDLSNELQSELNQRNEEVSKLQQVISDLQIHLFREKEHCLKLSAENDKLQIQEFEDRKKINALLMLTGAPSIEMLNVLTGNPKVIEGLRDCYYSINEGVYVERKLPLKLQKLKELKYSKLLSHNHNEKSTNEFEMDPQSLILKNQALAAQLEHHISISREQIQVLVKDRDLALEERQIERARLQKEINFLSSKLKQTQDNLCETSSKLIKCQQNFEREKNTWMDEKDKYVKTLKLLKHRNDEKYPDAVGYLISGVGCHRRTCAEAEHMKEQILEKEQLAASYQEQIIAMEAEINTLKERAQVCRNTFKEKMEKMNAQTVYLKNKYEDLDRRRQLEAEGFRTDIRMLRERLKDLEKKLAKANLPSVQPSEQQLLISARNTLNRARQLEKELINMKSKISVIGGNESM